VLRLRDGRTGSYVELSADPSTPLRVCIHGPSAGPGFGLADLRVLLVADVLTRSAELRGLQVIAVLTTEGLPPGPLAALERNASALGIHPPAARTSPAEAEASLGGSADVHVAGHAAGFGDCGDGVLIYVGSADDVTQQAAGGRAAEPASSAGNGGDLLALRLALLSRRHGQPVELTRAALAGAGETLSQWRRRVAEWADGPSRPIPRETATEIRMAFDDDLDTVAALAVLHKVEADHGMHTGAKFETFAFTDRILGLELVREIGRQRQ
jgi:hypothetical protein